MACPPCFAPSAAVPLRRVSRGRDTARDPLPPAVGTARRRAAPCARIITDKEREEIMRFEPEPARDYLTTDRVARLSRPMGLVLDSATDGRVFVSRVVPGGAAERDGGVREGDYVTRCSVPYGDGLAKVTGLDMVESQVKTRGEDEEVFVVVVRSSGKSVEELRGTGLVMDESDVRFGKSTSLDWLPVMQEVRAPGVYALASEEDIERMKKENQAMGQGIESAAVGEGEGEEGVDELFDVSDEVEERLKKKIRKMMETCEGMRGADFEDL